MRLSHPCICWLRVKFITGCSTVDPVDCHRPRQQCVGATGVGDAGDNETRPNPTPITSAAATRIQPLLYHGARRGVTGCDMGGNRHV